MAVSLAEAWHAFERRTGLHQVGGVGRALKGVLGGDFKACTLHGVHRPRVAGRGFRAAAVGADAVQREHVGRGLGPNLRQMAASAVVGANENQVGTPLLLETLGGPRGKGVQL